MGWVELGMGSGGCGIDEARGWGLEMKIGGELLGVGEGRGGGKWNGEVEIMENKFGTSGNARRERGLVMDWRGELEGRFWGR